LNLQATPPISISHIGRGSAQVKSGTQTSFCKQQEATKRYSFCLRAPAFILFRQGEISSRKLPAGNPSVIVSLTKH
jgi:hypothetical protein